MGASVRAVAVPSRDDVKDILRQHNGPAHRKRNPKAHLANAKMAKPSDRHECARHENHHRNQYDFHVDDGTVSSTWTATKHAFSTWAKYFNPSAGQHADTMSSQLMLIFLNINNRSYVLAIEGSRQSAGLESVDDLETTNMFGMKHILKNYAFYNEITEVHLQ